VSPTRPEAPEGTLLLIRHGIAEDPRHGIQDADRALTEEGWRKTRAAMRGLVKAGWVPAIAFASPYRRAAETLSCLSEAMLKAGLDSAPAGTWEGLVPEGDPAKAEAWLLTRLRKAGAGAVLAVISHQPFLGELVYRLCGENLEIKKASCTVIERSAGEWSLRRQYGPSELRDMG
jgi:phosphohistidine phosphatase